MSQADFARSIGIKTAALSNYLRGLCEPSYDDLKKIVTALGVTSDWVLFGGTNRPSRPSNRPDSLISRIESLPPSARRDVEGFLNVQDVACIRKSRLKGSSR